MRGNIQIYASPDSLAAALAKQILEATRQAELTDTSLSLALSGGSTPRRLFTHLAAEPYRTELPWPHLHLYWGDERCVPPDDPESNYGVADTELLSRVGIPPENIHRMRGEADPGIEATRYGEELGKSLPVNENGLPVFDWVLLGLGSDGHTASLFPETPALGATDEICLATTHPSTGQGRLTLSLAALNNARRITFLVTGREKAAIVRTILTTPPSEQSLPAGLVHPIMGQLEWLFDQAAASLL